MAAILKSNMAVMGGHLQWGQLIAYARKHRVSHLNFFRILIRTRVIQENIHLGVVGGGHLEIQYGGDGRSFLMGPADWLCPKT